MLIRFTKPVIGLSNYEIGDGNENVGNPGNQFHVVSLLCALALKLLKKLLKPPSYAGY